jgi:hypothetical protein
MEIAGLDLKYQHIDAPRSAEDYQVSEVVTLWSEATLAMRMHRFGNRILILLAGAVAEQRCYDGEGRDIAVGMVERCEKLSRQATHLQAMCQRAFSGFTQNVGTYFDAQFARALQMVESQWGTVDVLAASIRAQRAMSGAEVLEILETTNGARNASE